jgi:uncharacterized membrane protein
MLGLAGTESWMGWILRTLSMVGLFLGIWGIIVFGIRRLRQEGISIKNSFVPVVVVLFCVLAAFLNSRLHKVSGGVSQIFEIQDPNVGELDERFASGEIDMETYSEISLRMAQNRFLKDGSITEYTTADDQRVFFEPNESDRQLYMEMHQMRDLFRKVSNVAHWGVYFWSAIALFGTLLGFATPIKSKEMSD